MKPPLIIKLIRTLERYRPDIRQSSFLMFIHGIACGPRDDLIFVVPRNPNVMF
jgi:hypothetical protein